MVIKLKKYSLFMHRSIKIKSKFYLENYITICEMFIIF